MRVLFTVQPAIGHLHPLVPVAAALAAAGHEVTVCSSASFRADVEAFGLTHRDAGLDWLASDRGTWTDFPPLPPPGPRFAEFVVTIFADLTARRIVPDLLAIARDWRPDLVIRESMEYGGCIAAECLGIPHASVAGNAYSAVDSPDVGYFPGNRLMVAEPLARHREQFGLAPDPAVRMPFRHLHMCFTPPSWDRAGAPRPPNCRFLRHMDGVPPGATMPQWLRDLPDQPTVLASLGTVFNTTPGVLEAIIAGLGEESVNLIVVIGRDRDPAAFWPQPANVRLERYLPQPLLLPHCDLLITHGGFNSVKEALGAGVPMVVVPITADQPYSAERCAALGVGRVIGPEDRSAAAIREAAREVLEDPAYRERARRFQAGMQALPGPERMVALLERLAAAGSAEQGVVPVPSVAPAADRR
jgi:UDP:flavonoid glycosyltransferase YjiC (YdhE family)